MDKTMIKKKFISILQNTFQVKKKLHFKTYLAIY